MQSKQLKFNKLPGEIQDYIFDFVGHEMSVISRFVCRKWNQHNRRFSAKAKGCKFIYWLIGFEFFNVAKWAIEQGAKYKKRYIAKAAIVMGSTDMFDFLIAKGCHYDHHRILLYAASSGKDEVMKHLVEKYHVRCPFHLLDWAFIGGNTKCIDYTRQLRKIISKHSFPRLSRPSKSVSYIAEEDAFRKKRFDLLELNEFFNFHSTRFWQMATSLDQFEWLKKKQISGLKKFQIINFKSYSVEMTEWLFGEGKDFHEQDISNFIVEGNIPVVEFLLKKYSTKILDSVAILYSSVEALQWVVDHGIIWSKTYTHWIVSNDRLDVAQWLWKKGILFVHLEEFWEIGPNVQKWLKSLE